MAIDQYSKWCEAKTFMDHDVKTTTNFFECKVICKFGVPKYILTNNGTKWSVKFDQLCKNYGIAH